jgi:hypothetical protein
MENQTESSLDSLWREYSTAFQRFDDLTLARWMSQTLGQIEGRAWRLSHPLIGAYRLAAQIGHERQVWFKHLATPPTAYLESACCRAPMLPLLTRDIRDAGLICQHCGGTLTPFDEIPMEIRMELGSWAAAYAPIHEVAHMDEGKRKQSVNFDQMLEQAAVQAEKLLARMGNEIAPRLLEHFPAVIWEDQDECLEVRPEDVVL